MALIDLPITSATRVVAFRANNAPELQLALNAWLSGGHDDVNVFDCQLIGGGACPNFLCTLTVGEIDGAGGISYLPSNLSAVAVGGAGAQAIDPLAMAAALSEALRDAGAEELLAKAECACGGVGPHWMSVGLFGEGR